MTMIFSNKTYDILKWVCLICIPALIVFIQAVMPFFCNAEITVTVTTIVSGLGTFLGTLLGISCSNYQEGESHD